MLQQQQQQQQQQQHEIPHRGSLYRRSNVVHSTISYEYVIEIGFVPPPTPTSGQAWHRHQLIFSSQDYEFMSRLFSILDTDSRGMVSRQALLRFVTLRCPVFWRRDEDLRQLSSNHQNETTTTTMSPTFDEIWQAVVDCDPKQITTTNNNNNHDDKDNVLSLFNNPSNNNNNKSVGLGVEGWMVFCRFVALAQYLEAKRRFSARHLQQTMRHRNSPRGSELVVVNVPPPDSPKPLTPVRLVQYYQQSPLSSPLPLPELDLDHSLVAAHDVCQQHQKQYQPQRHEKEDEDDGGQRLHHCQKPRKTPVGIVKIALFGSGGGGGGSVVASKQHQPPMHSQHAHIYPYHHAPQSSLTSSSSAALMDFALTYQSYADNHNHNNRRRRRMDSMNGTEIVVRRSFADTKWLHETFQSHKGLGGTLCGRILPPFPADTATTALKTKFQPHERTLQDGTGAAVKVAAASVGMITHAAKSFWGNYLTSTKPETHTSNNTTTTNNNNNNNNNNGNHAATTSTKKAETIHKRSIHRTVSENYYNPNSATFKGRQIERYLNYLLEHPALSTSFPLNTILTVRTKRATREKLGKRAHSHTHNVAGKSVWFGGGSVDTG